MKTVKEAAREYAENRPYLSNEPEKIKYYNSFQAGVAFAQRWIPVEEELPEKQVLILVKKTSETMVVCKYTGKLWLDVRNATITNVAHWRYINLK